MILTLIGWGVAVLTVESRAGDTSSETPRATDLLRAQRLAAQVNKRLEVPSSRGPGWVHGGDGFGGRRGVVVKEERAPEVHIHVGGGQKKRAR